MVTDAGSVAAFGGVAYSGSLNLPLRQPIAAMAKGRGGRGYWLADADGTVFGIGDVANYGSLPRGAAGHHNPVTGMASTPSGKGYWLVTAGGGVFSFGDATYHGSMGLSHLDARVVGITATPDGRGYWLASADGGVFAYGDARYMGSARHVHHRAPIVAIAATPDGRGYRLASTRGGVWTFGDARYLGHASRASLFAPIVDIEPSPEGQGYWLVGADGGVLTFGNAAFRGSGHATLPHGQKVVAMVPSEGVGKEVASAGAFGPSSPSPLHRPTPPPKPVQHQHPGAKAKPVARKAAPPKGAHPGERTRPPKATPPPKGAHPSKHRAPSKPKAPSKSKPAHSPRPLAGPRAYPNGATGYDVSWPQCHGPLPPHATVAIVGVNGGVAFTGNPCFTREARWAGANLTTYINLNSPRGSNPAVWRDGPAGRCAPGALYCESYNFGYNTAQYSVRSARLPSTRSRTWWLDVETAGGWSFSQRANAQVVAGAIAALRADRLRPAVYSTAYQWDIITGGYVPGTSAWYPTGIATSSPNRWCTARSFAGGPVALVQSAAGRFDGDYSC